MVFACCLSEIGASDAHLPIDKTLAAVAWNASNAQSFTVEEADTVIKTAIVVFSASLGPYSNCRSCGWAEVEPRIEPYQH